MVLPTVSWSKDEYAALGVPFAERGKILDEQLEVLAKAWGPYPIRHEGTYFPFGDVWLEPGAFRPEGPTMWFGGQGMHPPLVRRLAKYGHGLNPFGSLTDDDLALLAEGMRAEGRELADLEMVGGIRGTFHGPDDLADLDQALESLPRQLAQGYTTICFKPAMFIDHVSEMDAFCRELVAKTDAIAAEHGLARPHVTDRTVATRRRETTDSISYVGRACVAQSLTGPASLSAQLVEGRVRRLLAREDEAEDEPDHEETERRRRRSRPSAPARGTRHRRSRPRSPRGSPGS